jgi:hypothetical protein
LLCAPLCKHQSAGWSHTVSFHGSDGADEGAVNGRSGGGGGDSGGAGGGAGPK